MATGLLPRLETYSIKKRIEETPHIVTLQLNPQSGGLFSFKAGQFVMLHPHDRPEVKDGRAISIASSPRDTTLDLTIKMQGPWSRTIAALREGDLVLVKGPYGLFSLDEDVQEVVMLASGVGITPFRSMIRMSMEKELPIRFFLCYSNKTIEDIVYREEFLSWKQHKNLTVVHTLTQENKVPPGYEQGRITKEFLVRHTHALRDPQYLICGAPEFVANARGLLKELNIRDQNVHYERFTGITNGA